VAVDTCIEFLNLHDRPQQVLLVLHSPDDLAVVNRYLASALR
jgi:hypothetical protein